MADRYLKHLPSGQVFIYAPPFIDNPEFEEVADAQGTPLGEPETVVNPTPRAKRAKVKAEDIEIDLNDAALSADASRGLAAQGL